MKRTSGNLRNNYKKLYNGGWDTNQSIDRFKKDWSGTTWNTGANPPYASQTDDIHGGSGIDISGVANGSSSNTQKTDYRNYIGAGLSTVGSFIPDTKFGDFRDDTDKVTKGVMNVVGQAGWIGALISGIYSVVNPLAKMARAKIERTDAYGNLKDSNAANKGAWIGSILDPIQGITTRAKLGYWGVNRRKYSDLLQKKLTEKYNQQQQPFRQARKLELDNIAYQNSLNQPQQSNYYAFGGQLKNYTKYTTGGKLKPLSSDSSLVLGNSHEDGGVKLNKDTEVEGKETIKGDYVFSDRLGFAKIHKKLAKAKGNIENKPATAERLNSVKLIEQKEKNLQEYQEYIRNKLNLV